MNADTPLYTPIAPPPANPQALADPELTSLARVWHDKRQEIEAGGQLEGFLARMKRDWAIETGLIERLYVWDRGVTELLIEQGLDDAIIRNHAGARQAHAAAIIRDQSAVIDGLFGYIEGELPLTQHYIRQLHQQLTANQPTTEAIDALGHSVEVRLLRGEYKKQPNNPRRPDGRLHAYCPPEQVVDEMERLIAGAQALEAAAAPPEVFAAWLHYAFTHIHPFQDGNGRVARALATLIFLRAGLFPLIVRNDQRSEYIDALEKADAGDLVPLIKLFAHQQRNAVLQALGLAQQAKRGLQLEQQLAAALRMRHEKASDARQTLDRLSNRLFESTLEAFERWCDELQALLDANAPPDTRWQARCSSARHGAGEDYWFRRRIYEAANEPRWRYYANLDAYRAWVRLSLRTDFEFNLVVSLHGYGTGSGVRAVCAFAFDRLLDARRQPSEAADVEAQFSPTRPLIEPFLYNYHETEDNLLPRYATWLDEVRDITRAEWLIRLQKE